MGHIVYFFLTNWISKCNKAYHLFTSVSESGKMYLSCMIQYVRKSFEPLPGKVSQEIHNGFERFMRAYDHISRKKRSFLRFKQYFFHKIILIGSPI